MCRQLAYLGPPVTLESLVLSPEHSLLHQAYKPKHQRHGVVNADGFGCGWFAPEVRREPAVYRRDKPIWSDRTFASLAGAIVSGAVMAAVRDASTGSAVEESSASPFTENGWLFAHNGMFEGFHGPPGIGLRRLVSERRSALIRGTSDSEVLFALILDRIDEGAAPGEALSWCVDVCLKLSRGTFNFLLMEQDHIYATACGDSLFVREGGISTAGGVVVASEPFDDDPAWTPVPDASEVEGFGGGVTVRPLKEDL